MRTLKQLNLIKPIINIFGDNVIMLDPEYLFFNAREEKPFNIALYTFGSHDMALQWREWCIDQYITINARTGRPMYAQRGCIDEYAGGYSIHDRNYRKKEQTKQYY
jgi:hypothetical protein